MHHFDEWLRNALMDANLLQFEKVLAEVGAQSFDFSPKYLRERTRMLADPFGWARRRGRSARNRAALYAYRCLEELALYEGWVTEEQVHKIGDELAMTLYGKYLQCL